MKKITLCSLFLVLVFTPGVLQAAFECTSVTDSEHTVTVSNLSGVNTALGNYSSYLKDGSYVICFQVTTDDGNIPVTPDTNYLEILGRDKPLVIYGLSLEPGSSGRPLVEYTGTLVSVTGSNITLRNLTLTKTNIAEDVTTPALSITGSNIQVIDSTITATQTGVSISGGSDIAIESTAITGPEPSATNSTGIQIAGAQEVSIDNGTLLKNLDTGVSGAANVLDTDFDNVSTPINNAGTSAATTVDTSKAGKKLNDDGKKVTKIAGSDPAGSCNADQAANGHVNLYLKTTYASSYSYQGNCPIKLLSGSDSICIYHGAGVAPDNKDKCVEANDCICYNAGACVFDCEDLNIGIDKVASFAYIDNLGNTYDLTTPINISDLGTWLATLAPAAPLDAGDLTGGDDGTATGDDGGSNLVGVEAGGEDGGSDVSGVSSLSIAKGCSLVPTKDSRLRGNDRHFGNDKRDIRWIATALGLAMTMLSVPVVMRVRAKRRSIK